MQLYIRSQDKEVLMLINTIALAKDEMGAIIGYGIDGKVNYILGKYETKERALEVLDEIQSKRKSLFICKPNPTLSLKNIDKAEAMLNMKYKNNNFIMQLPGIDIEPVCIGTFVYEMPEK